MSKDKKRGFFKKLREKNWWKWFMFGLVGGLYLAWCLWLWNFWLMLGIIVIFDMYITKKVRWAFWKGKNGKKNRVVEWIDALLFAVIAVTFINIFLFQNYKIPTGSMEKTLRIGDHLFVSKLKYGPKVPNTPLAFPFAQNILPFTTNVKSYLDWIQWDYKRLAGFDELKNDDIVVFNYPAGDTVLTADPASCYYLVLLRNAEFLAAQDRENGLEDKGREHYMNISRQFVLSEYEIMVHPVDRRDNYVKRCVGVAGDSIEIRDGWLYVNSKPQEQFEGIQFRHEVVTDGSRLNPKTLEKLDIYQSDVWDLGGGKFEIPMTLQNAEDLRKMGMIKSVTKITSPKGSYNYEIFPHDAHYPWNLDNFGPLWVPKKGATIELDTVNIVLYERIITAYEGHKLQVRDGQIFIDNQPSTQYTFAMDYFWMMGDNRHDSLDSRFWGFVPEDHIVGAPRFIWLSLDKEKSFPFNIRWDRMFKSAGR